jgi:hypothetical protein
MAAEMEKSMARKIKRSRAAAASVLSTSPSMPRSARNLEAVATQVAHDHELLRWVGGTVRVSDQLGQHPGPAVRHASCMPAAAWPECLHYRHCVLVPTHHTPLLTTLEPCICNPMYLLPTIISAFTGVCSLVDPVCCRERVLRLAGPQGIARLEAALEAAREVVEQESDVGTASELESASASEVEGESTLEQGNDPAACVLTH